ncbi:type IV pilus biogenesis protein PilM [Thermicanus aegyptius]|uniref:type IV pilus biogenesis protein PilM n=1 Tax=Thermicanus aegyptius TaxID=94009 RepID=UPI00048A5ACE|nr:pilus assembly protein PilM [Thermicanus aegyptius]
MFSFMQQIGLSFTLQDIRYCQLKDVKTKMVRKVGKLSLPKELVREEGITDPALLYDVMKGWVKEERLKGKQVILSLPTSHIFIRKLKVPPMKEKDLYRYLELEIAGSLYLPFENPVFDYTLEKGENGEEDEAILFITPGKILNDYLDVLEELGLHVTAIDLPSLSLLRFLTFASEEAGEGMMILYLTQEGMELYIYDRGIPEFMRSLTLEQENFVLAQGNPALRWNDVLTEIRRMFNFYQYNMHEEEKRVTHLYFFGRHSGKEEFLQILRQEFDGVTVREVPLSYTLENGGDGELEDYALPLGLVLRGKIHEKR